MAQRGRKKGSVTVNIETKLRPRKYVEKYTEKVTGIIHITTWNLDISPNGPISVELKYPEGYKLDVEHEEDLPKSQRKYLNPKNGKMVGYTRAYNLGLLDK